MSESLNLMFFMQTDIFIHCFFIGFALGFLNSPLTEHFSLLEIHVWRDGIVCELLCTQGQTRLYRMVFFKSLLLSFEK